MDTSLIGKSMLGTMLIGTITTFPLHASKRQPVQYHLYFIFVLLVRETELGQQGFCLILIEWNAVYLHPELKQGNHTLSISCD